MITKSNIKLGRGQILDWELPALPPLSLSRHIISNLRHPSYFPEVALAGFCLFPEATEGTSQKRYSGSILNDYMNAGRSVWVQEECFDKVKLLFYFCKWLISRTF